MRVGLLHARSGVAGVWAPSLDAAAALAAADINASGGVLGQSIELAARDCGGSINQAIDAVDTLIELDGADVIVGCHASSLRDAVSERIAGATPYIYTAQYEGTACGASTVAIGSTDRELIAPALSWLRDNKRAERFFFVGDDYIWPRMALQSVRGILRAQGGRLVGEVFVDERRQGDDDLMRRIARSGAQVVILALIGQSAIAFNRAFAVAGLDEKMLRFGLIVDETVICGIGAEASVNLFTAAHYFASQRSKTNDSFLERYHDAFGEWAPAVSASSVHCYEGLHLFAKLARDLGTLRGRDLARHLDRPLSQRAARSLLGDKPVGRSPAVRLAEADGVLLRVIAEFAA